MSYCPMISIALSEVIGNSCVSTVTCGLYASNDSFAERIFGRPTSCVWCKICRCRFDASTTSKSTRPMRPTPAGAR